MDTYPPEDDGIYTDADGTPSSATAMLRSARAKLQGPGLIAAIQQAVATVCRLLEDEEPSCHTIYRTLGDAHILFYEHCGERNELATLVMTLRYMLATAADVILPRMAKCVVQAWTLRGHLSDFHDSDDEDTWTDRPVDAELADSMELAGEAAFWSSCQHLCAVLRNLTFAGIPMNPGLWLKSPSDLVLYFKYCLVTLNECEQSLLKHGDGYYCWGLRMNDEYPAYALRMAIAPLQLMRDHLDVLLQHGPYDKAMVFPVRPSL